MGWFQNVVGIEGPFDSTSIDDIYNTALLNGHLNAYFGPWNSAHSGDTDTTIQKYIMHLKESGAGGCVMEGGVSS